MRNKVKELVEELLAVTVKRRREQRKEVIKAHRVHLEDLRRGDAAISSIRKRGGTRWESIKRLKLQVNRHYLVRRAYSSRIDGRRMIDIPVVARWTKDGWRSVVGHLYSGSGRNPDIQVWV